MGAGRGQRSPWHDCSVVVDEYEYEDTTRVVRRAPEKMGCNVQVSSVTRGIHEAQTGINGAIFPPHRASVVLTTPLLHQPVVGAGWICILCRECTAPARRPPGQGGSKSHEERQQLNSNQSTTFDTRGLGLSWFGLGCRYP
jgi:hypothetical protein